MNDQQFEAACKLVFYIALITIVVGGCIADTKERHSYLIRIKELELKAKETK